MANVLAALQAKADALEQERGELAVQRQAIDSRERSLEETWEKKYTSKIREVEQHAAALAEQFEKQARETIQDLSQKARTKIAKTRREYQEAVESLAPTPVRPTGGPAPAKLEEGARVRLKGVRQVATVRRVFG